MVAQPKNSPVAAGHVRTIELGVDRIGRQVLKMFLDRPQSRTVSFMKTDPGLDFVQWNTLIPQRKVSVNWDIKYTFDADGKPWIVEVIDMQQPTTETPAAPATAAVLHQEAVALIKAAFPEYTEDGIKGVLKQAWGTHVYGQALMSWSHETCLEKVKEAITARQAKPAAPKPSPVAAQPRITETKRPPQDFESDPFAEPAATNLYLKLGLIGPSGSGKTFTALRIASDFAPGGKIALIDSERGSAALYRKQFSFRHLPLQSFHPQAYIDAINAAVKFGYDVVVIDSLSHAWDGTGGVLDIKDAVSKAMRSANDFTAWRDVTPLHNDLVDAIVSSPIHTIVTIRAKQGYEMVTTNGKVEVKKVGMEPIQRAGMEYELSVVLDLTMEHTATASKTRCDILTNKVFTNPGKDVAEILRKWLDAA